MSAQGIEKKKVELPCAAKECSGSSEALERSASESGPYNGAAWHEFGEARAVCRIGERQHAGLKPRHYISEWAMLRRRREVSDSGLIEEHRQECLRYGRGLARVD
jgi:hypothetical protein